jgi:hypothetical protein
MIPRPVIFHPQSHFGIKLEPHKFSMAVVVSDIADTFKKFHSSPGNKW